MAELIPGARLCVIAGAAHCPQEERPELFNAALREFLRSGRAERRLWCGRPATAPESHVLPSGGEDGYASTLLRS